MANFSSLITNSYSNIGISASTKVYATPAQLPLTGLSAGDIAYVISTQRFYVSNGSGWNSMTLTITGQQAYTTPGTYSWTAPSGVTSVSVVAVGGGGAGGGRGTHITNGSGGQGGSGGGLGWKNNITVVPGQSYTIVVGAGGLPGAANDDGGSGGNSYFINTSTICGFGGPGGRAGSNANVGSPQAGGSYTGDGGGIGGSGGIGQNTTSSPSNPSGGGGGAGGYSGTGGAGGNANVYNVYNGGGTATGGGGGGGSSGGVASGGYRIGSGGGGGVGIFGEGSSGVGGAQPTYFAVATYGGQGGSGGISANNNSFNGGYTPGSDGGSFGGGGGGHGLSPGPRPGAGGAVRIIWGAGRSFPSTLTADQ